MTTIRPGAGRGGFGAPSPSPAGPSPAPSTPADPAPSRRGFARLGTLGGVPVWVHWSLPAGGVSAAVFGQATGPREWLYFTAAYALLIGAHEAGHAIVARRCGLRVSAVEVTGTGGLCRSERPRTVAQAAWLYAAGLVVQLGLFLATLGFLATHAAPAAGFGAALVTTLTTYNVFLFVLNLVPQLDSLEEHTSDGSMLWKLWRHARHGHPHPCPPLTRLGPGAAPVFPPETRLLARPGFRPAGFVCGVEILSDAVTPAAFVEEMLRTHLGLTAPQAEVLALDLHNTGGVVLGYRDARTAHAAAAAIATEAHARGWPLVCRYAGPVELLAARPPGA